MNHLEKICPPANLSRPEKSFFHFLKFYDPENVFIFYLFFKLYFYERKIKDILLIDDKEGKMIRYRF